MQKSHIISKYITKILILTTIFVIIIPLCLAATDNLAERLAGKIVLQVESHGEAWYINPSDLKKYFLNRPADGLALMKKFGIGITNKDLTKIPIGLIANNNIDGDGDGLDNALEVALGTDPLKIDGDGDGFNDRDEILKNYNPNGNGKIYLDDDFTKKHLGKIFLQVEKNGEAWYINLSDNKRYFLGRPADFFNLLKKLGLGITNEDLNKIMTGELTSIPPPLIQPPIVEKEIIYDAANAIRAKNKTLTASYFISEMKKSIEYNLDNMSDESILALGNILSGSKLTSTTDTEKIYSNDVYFSLGDQYIHLDFIVKKQSDGNWLMTNL
ncbi:MAG: hypothetical protein WCL13_02145 [bacterium]